MGLLARHYAWVNGDLDIDAYGSYKVTADKNLSINSTSNGISANKLAGIVIDVNEKFPNGDGNENIFSGQNISISVQGKKAQNLLVRHFQDIWGDSDASAVELLNGSISISGDQSVSIKTVITESADQVRGLVSAAKTTDIQPGNSCTYCDYQNSAGQGHLYLSEGLSTSRITSDNGSIEISALAKNADEVQGILWRSSGTNDLEPELPSLTALKMGIP